MQLKAVTISNYPIRSDPWRDGYIPLKDNLRTPKDYLRMSAGYEEGVTPPHSLQPLLKETLLVLSGTRQDALVGPREV